MPDFRLLGIFPAIKAQEEKKEADWCPSFSPPTNRYPVYYADICYRWDKPGGGKVGDSHIKGTGMLVVSLRGVNFGFWSRLGSSGQNRELKQ